MHIQLERPYHPRRLHCEDGGIQSEVRPTNWIAPRLRLNAGRSHGNATRFRTNSGICFSFGMREEMPNVGILKGIWRRCFLNLDDCRPPQERVFIFDFSLGLTDAKRTSPMPSHPKKRMMLSGLSKAGSAGQARLNTFHATRIFTEPCCSSEESWRDRATGKGRSPIICAYPLLAAFTWSSRQRNTPAGRFMVR
jgi:hypothetical protein